jgi:hypothetical protein
MDPAEKQQFLTMQQDINVVKQDVAEIGKKVDKLLMYVVGDENSRETSMLARIRDLEKQLEEQDKKYVELKEDRNKDSIYIKIMWSLVGAVGMALLGVVVYWLKSK